MFDYNEVCHVLHYFFFYFLLTFKDIENFHLNWSF